jgi:NTE family protein
MRRRSLFAVAAAPLAGAAAAALSAPTSQRIGFALGSGAVHGWAHIGVVRACERLGLKPFAIAGTSAGAAVAALWAAGVLSEQMVTLAAQLGWSQAGPLAWSSRGLRRTDDLRDLINAALGRRPIEALPVRLATVASDALSGEAVVLDRGSAGLAVAASSAVPVWFEPVRIGGRDLMDGSLTAPVPVDAARQLGAQVVVAVDVGYRPYEKAPAGMVDLAFQSMHILTNALSREQSRRAEHVIKLDLHHLMHGGLDTAALVEAGEAAMLDLAPALMRR